MQEKEQGILLNSQVKDSGSKMIFDEPILCAQFIRDYVDLPYMKDVKPEDIEDVSEQFVPLFAEERNADRVKKVTINGEVPFFLVSLIEHKTGIEYNVSMQIFRYMVYIWEAFEKESERKQQGITKRKEFRYPPILPIIYYEGSDRWTAPLDFRSRIDHGEVFGKYIPDFEYYLVPLRRFSNEELLRNADEISLIMLVNKLQTEEDLAEFWQLPMECLEDIMKETPEYLIDVMAKVMLAFLLKANVTVPEATDFVGKVRYKDVAELFGNIKIDFQEMRKRYTEGIREAEEQKKEAEEQKKEAEEYIQRAQEHIEEVTEKSMRLIIESGQEMGGSKEKIIKKLVTGFQISEEVAKTKVEEYWK